MQPSKKAPLMPKGVEHTTSLFNADPALVRLAEQTTRAADVWFVPGADGGVYEVTESRNGFLLCQCKGYFYRQHCKHVDVVKMIEKLMRQWR